jgi:dihydroorotate dehydrogenase electron transfer subunit
MYLGNVMFNREIAPGHFLMSISVPEDFDMPTPGQFVMIRLRDRQDPFLGRPLCIYAFERQGDRSVFEVLYRVQGKGTSLLSHLREGDGLDIQGPLGTGFHAPSSLTHVVLVAGGMGVAPITFLAAHFRHASSFLKITCYLGSKSADCVFGLEKLQDFCTEVIITTDDGTMGTCGFVTDVFFRDLDYMGGEDTRIYACGPYEMMKCLAESIGGREIICQVSLEERMACGIGACLGCAVSLKKETGQKYYGRVCKDGPCFDISRINWD